MHTHTHRNNRKKGLHINYRDCLKLHSLICWRPEECTPQHVQQSPVFFMEADSKTLKLQSETMSINFIDFIVNTGFLLQGLSAILQHKMD